MQREGFLAAVSGWMLIDSVEHIAEKLNDANKWLVENGPPTEEEKKTLSLMIKTQIAKGILRGDFVDCGIFPGDEERILNGGDF